MRKKLELEVLGCGKSKDIQLMKLSKSLIGVKKIPKANLKESFHVQKSLNNSESLSLVKYEAPM